MGEGTNTDHETRRDAQMREGYKLWVERGKRDAWRERKEFSLKEIKRINEVEYKKWKRTFFMISILASIPLLLLGLFFLYKEEMTSSFFFLELCPITILIINLIEYIRNKDFWLCFRNSSAFQNAYYLAGQEKRGEKLGIMNVITEFLLLSSALIFLLSNRDFEFFLALLFGYFFSSFFSYLDIQRIMKSYRKREKEVGGL